MTFSEAHALSLSEIETIYARAVAWDGELREAAEDQAARARRRR